MTIDYSFLKALLGIFLASNKSTVTWNDFADLRGDNDDKFVFHVEILADDGFLVPANEERSSLGIQRGFADEYYVSIVPWRLTARGHDFAATLQKPGAIETVLKKLSGEGLSVVFEVLKQFATQQAVKLLTS